MLMLLLYCSDLSVCLKLLLLLLLLVTVLCTGVSIAIMIVMTALTSMGLAGAQGQEDILPPSLVPLDK